MRPLPLGLLVAAITLAADQALKLWLLLGFGLAANGPVELAPFAEIVLVWNRGISYGLFTQDGEAGRWALVAVSIVACALLALWLRREARPLNAMGLGLVLGGAIGNGIDRVAWGAVVDFVHLKFGEFSWYVFNVADAAIVAGVGLLLYGALVRPGRDRGPEPNGRSGSGASGTA